MLLHFLFHSETLRLQGLKCKARGSKCKARRLEDRNTRLEGSRLEGSRLEIRGSKARGSKARGSKYKARRLEGSRLEGSTYRILHLVIKTWFSLMKQRLLLQVGLAKLIFDFCYYCHFGAEQRRGDVGDKRD